jgi:hypothetical protein
MNAGNLNSKWVDPDDAPEITAEDLKRGIWTIDGKIVSENEGRDAFVKKLRADPNLLDHWEADV